MEKEKIMNKKCSDCYHHYSNEHCNDTGVEVTEDHFYCGAKEDEFLEEESGGSNKPCSKFIED